MKKNPLYEFLEINPGTAIVTYYNAGIWMILSRKRPIELFYPEGTSFKDGFLIVYSEDKTSDSFPFIKVDGNYWLDN